MFVSYPKIHRLGKEETDGLLDLEVILQEKIDGANTSIWVDDGVIKRGSRRRDLGDEGFNGFKEYVDNHEGIKKFLFEHPDLRLFGEWLVRHTISYNELAYKQFYLFDIQTDNGQLLDQVDVKDFADYYGIKYPQVFGRGIFTEEQIKDFVGKTNLGDKGEGVVIKSINFINKFGDHSYAKVVSEKFKENNALVFGGNNKHSETYNEMRVVNKFCTLARVKKIMHKIQPLIEKRLDFEHTPRVANSCYHDMLVEEIWDIQKSVSKIDFKVLKRLCSKKFIQIYHDVLNNNLSVADKGNE